MSTAAAPQSSQLFQRTCTVQVGSLLIQAGQGTGLDVKFTVKRGVKVTQGAQKPQPNTCDLSIWNLSSSHQKQIEQSTVPGAKKTIVPVVITAGYEGRSSVIFSGELRAGNTVTDGPSDVTELTTGDGDQALTQARLNLALGPGATASQALKAILAGLGVGDGNLQAGLALLGAQPQAARMFQKGACLKGAAADIMSDFCRASGLAWSVQNGALQMTALGQPLSGQAVLIDSDHGMIGSPTVDTKGLLSVSTLMLPDIFPGTKLSMNAARVKGGFAVLSVETTGATYGNEWGHNIEAQRY